MGDALAVAVLEARGFTRQDFARSHPGGALGRKLLLHVEDLMRTGDAVPRVAPDAPLSAGLLEMSRKGLGMTVVVDAAGHVLGVFTDGDLRRALDKQIDVHATVMKEVMTPNGKSIGPRELAAEAVHLMEVHRITALPVADGHGRLVGALNVHDLLRAGVCEPASVAPAMRAAIRLLVLDVDGVLTDGRLYFGAARRGAQGLPRARRLRYRTAAQHGCRGRGDLRASLGDGARALSRARHRSRAPGRARQAGRVHAPVRAAAASPMNGLRLRRR